VDGGEQKHSAAEISTQAHTKRHGLAYTKAKARRFHFPGRSGSVPGANVYSGSEYRRGLMAVVAVAVRRERVLTMMHKWYFCGSSTHRRTIRAPITVFLAWQVLSKAKAKI